LENPNKKLFSESVSKPSQDDGLCTSTSSGDQQTKLLNTNDAIKPCHSKKPRTSMESTWKKSRLEEEDDLDYWKKAATNATEEWEECLDNPLMASGIRSSKQVLVAATATSNKNRTTATEPPPESQMSENVLVESQQPIQSDVSEPYRLSGEVHGTTEKSLVGMMVCQALQYLHTHHEKNSLQEKEHTHWVVNRLVDVVFKCLKNLVSKEKDKFLPLEGLHEGIKLYFYKETKDSKQKSEHFPDCALYLNGKKKERAMFINKDATVGVLVSFEQKTSLKSNALLVGLEEAYKELCHDLAKKVDPLNVFTPTVRYRVITDGIDWFFLQMESKIKENEVHLETFASKRIIIWEESSRKNIEMKDQVNFSKLAKWLFFVVHKSVIERTTAQRSSGNVPEP
jgi:hypothetical protein